MRKLLLTVIYSIFFLCTSNFTLQANNSNSKTNLTTVVTGSDCNDPTVIMTLPYQQTGLTTEGAGNDYFQSPCNSNYMSGEDYVFTYTPSSDEYVDVTLNNVVSYTGLHILDNCPDSSPDCIGSSLLSAAGSRSVSGIFLTGGATYYFVISTWATPDFTPFDIEVTLGSPPPTGSDCNNPMIINAIPFSDVGQNTNNFGDHYTGSGTCANTNYLTGDEIIYAYTPLVDEGIEIELTNLTDTYAGIQVFDDCLDGNPNCLGSATNTFSTDDLKVENLNLIAGTTYYIVVSTYATPQFVGFDLSINPPPACPAPTDLDAANITDISSELLWTSNGNLWQVEYGTTGFTQGSGTVVSSTATTFLLENLTPSTSYDYFVQDDCGLDGMSIWSGPFTFVTKDPLPICAGNFYDNGGSAGNYNNSITDETIVICPQVGGEVVSINFSLFNLENSGDNCYDELMIFNGDDVTDPVISSPNGTTQGWCWDKQVGSEGGSGNLEGMTLTSTDASGCLTFVFNSDGLVNREGWEATVTCGLPPTCPSPTSLNVLATTHNSAEVTWQSGGGTNLSTTNIEWGPVGFTNGNGDSEVVTGNSFVIVDLWPATMYEFYVQDNCDLDGTSAWVGPFAFTTECAPFEGDSFMDPIFVNMLPYTDSLNSSECFSNQLGNTSPDAFFTFTTSSCADSLIFSTCSLDSDFDTYIRLLDATGNEIAANDDSNSNCDYLLNGFNRFSVIVQDVDPNTVYTAVVEGYSNNSGNFGIELLEISMIDTMNVLTTVNDITCNGITDGSINVTVDGGTEPLSFTWNGVVGTSNPTELEAGTYQLEITDACGQVISEMYEISEPEILQVTASTTDESSEGANDGTATCSPIGGTAPYTYLWNNGTTTQNINELAVGEYCVTITDAVGCTTESCNLVLAGPTATKEISDLSKLNISPNPASENVLLEIEFKTSKDIQIEMFSATGQLIFSMEKEKVSAEKFNIDISKYASGVYFVKITSENQRTTRRLIIE